jgi:hypothetical protein
MLETETASKADWLSILPRLQRIYPPVMKTDKKASRYIRSDRSSFAEASTGRAAIRKTKYNKPLMIDTVFQVPVTEKAPII